jgi:uncharacterized protein (TIGR02588 family)
MNVPSKNWVEWAVFAIGLTLLLAVAGYLTYTMLTETGSPAQLTVELGEPQLVGENHMVPVTVTNSGETSAENVYVEVTLTGATEPLRSTVELAFVPRGSSGDGWVAFPEPPAPDRLRARVLGYEEP